MFLIFLFVRYLRRTLNYHERITLFVLTHVMTMADHMAIGVEAPKIDSRCSLEREFTELIWVNPQMILY